MAGDRHAGADGAQPRSDLACAQQGGFVAARGRLLRPPLVMCQRLVASQPSSGTDAHDLLLACMLAIPVCQIPRLFRQVQTARSALRTCVPVPSESWPGASSDLRTRAPTWRAFSDAPSNHASPSSSPQALGPACARVDSAPGGLCADTQVLPAVHLLTETSRTPCQTTLIVSFI